MRYVESKTTNINYFFTVSELALTLFLYGTWEWLDLHIVGHLLDVYF